MKKKGEGPVSRVARRRPNQGREQAYESLVKGMLEASSRFPGYLSATVIPPHTDSDHGIYKVVQRFATQADLDRWDQSEERAMWHDRISPIADHAAAYHPIQGLEVWFPPSSACSPDAAPPPKWKMTVVSWLGIFPTASLCLGASGPLLGFLPFLLRMAIITAMVALLMAYVVMPRLSVWMRWWLRG